MIRYALSRLVRRGLVALTDALPPPRIIFDREGGSPYLSRWYLLGKGVDTDNGMRPVRGLIALGPVSVFVHRFHRSDDDGALHSHPWRWSVALVLVGGYYEERRVGDSVVRRKVLPFSINVIKGDDYHRVDLLTDDAWSIFVAGPKASSWYFWDRETKLRAPWRSFIAARRGEGADAAWEPDTRAGAFWGAA